MCAASVQRSVARVNRAVRAWLGTTRQCAAAQKHADAAQNRDSEWRLVDASLCGDMTIRALAEHIERCLLDRADDVLVEKSDIHGDCRQSAVRRHSGRRREGHARTSDNVMGSDRHIRSVSYRSPADSSSALVRLFTASSSVRRLASLRGRAASSRCMSSCTTVNSISLNISGVGIS